MFLKKRGRFIFRQPACVSLVGIKESGSIEFRQRIILVDNSYLNRSQYTSIGRLFDGFLPPVDAAEP